MATVLALTPNYGYFGTELSAGNTWINLNWENKFSAADDVTNGAAAIDSALRTVKGPKIVYGHSMAAEAACLWLRKFGPTSSVDPHPNNVRFILAANPERQATGITQVPTPVSPQPVYENGKGFPSETPYTVTDFARQYDLFADYPNIVDPNSVAVDNVYPWQGFLIHVGYYSVSLATNNANNTVWQEGNVTYITSKTPLIDEALRPEIEAGYQRPVPVR